MELVNVDDLDMDRLPFLIQAMIDAHPNHDRIVEIAERSPGCDIRRLDDGVCEVTITDLDRSVHVVGKFDTEVLARFNPPISDN